MFKAVLVSGIILLASCATHIVEQQEEQITVKVQNLIILQGETKLLKVPLPTAYIVNKITCLNNNEFIYHRTGNVIKSYIVVSVKQSIRPFKCEMSYSINGTTKTEVIANFQVVKKDFESETLNVPKRTIDLSKKDLKRYFKEKKIIVKAYANPNNTPLFSKPFQQPLNSFITSSFGRRRIYNNKKENQHGGVDFRAKMNTPIPVANSGKVVLAMDLFFNGKSVLIDHGMGIFTIYSHLNKIRAQVGEYVPQGAIIGLSGMTGRVSGPHLHWGVRINRVNVDGLNFIKAGI